MNDPSLYTEEQRFSQWWVRAIVVAVAAVAWWTFIRQIVLGRPVGEEPLPDWGAWVLWVLIGLGMPALLFLVKLVFRVDSTQVLVRYTRLFRRSIPLAEIERVEVRTYDPIKEYGGWGVKGWSRNNVAYNASGDRGVQLTLQGGRKVMLGSQRPEELARAIETQRLGATTPGGLQRSSS